MNTAHRARTSAPRGAEAVAFIPDVLAGDALPCARVERARPALEQTATQTATPSRPTAVPLRAMPASPAAAAVARECTTCADVAKAVAQLRAQFALVQLALERLEPRVAALETAAPRVAGSANSEGARAAWGNPSALASGVDALATVEKPAALPDVRRTAGNDTAHELRAFIDAVTARLDATHTLLRET